MPSEFIANPNESLGLPRKLIINADDFGHSNVVTDAIVAAHAKGYVTSTSVLPNLPGFEYAATIRSRVPQLGIGAHLNITEGEPVLPASEVSSLVQNGRFLGAVQLRRKINRGQINYNQVVSELDGQLKKCLRAGFELTHIDSHHHVHTVPFVYLAVRHVAKQHGISRIRLSRNLYVARRLNDCVFTAKPPRQYGMAIQTGKLILNSLIRLEFTTTKWFITFDPSDGYGPSSCPPEVWNTLVRQLPVGSTEISCHLGHFTRDEDRIFGSGQFMYQLSKTDIALASWSDLRDKRQRSFWSSGLKRRSEY